MNGFFDRWGPQMAYVLGYWLADGNMYSQPSCGGYSVSFGSKEFSVNNQKGLRYRRPS